MKKQKIIALLPILLISGFLINAWWVILSTDQIATWRHYVGLVLFLPIVGLFLFNYKKALLATCVFCFIGIFNLLTITPSVVSATIGKDFGSFKLVSPPFNFLSLVLLLFTVIINFDTLTNMYLDYKEEKAASKN